MTAFALVSIILCAIGMECGRQIHLSLFYRVGASYAEMPADDHAVESWLKEQPGVAPHTVHIHRNGNKLRVTFIMSQNVFRNPPFPDLEQISGSLGYGPPTTWTDVGQDQ